MDKKRDYRFEFVRIVAFIAVIGVHTFGVLAPDGTELRKFTIDIVSSLVSCGNGIFFMMSGMFALRKPIEEGKYGDFYFKKLVYLILPLIIYMIFYTMSELYLSTGTFQGLGKILLTNILYRFSAGYHFWFMYVLVGMILISPFIARAIDGLSKKTALLLVSLGVLYNIIYSYTPYFTGYVLAWSCPFSMWTTYFIVGGCFNKIITTSTDRKIVYGLGILGFIIMILKPYFFSYQQFIFDMAPSYFFYALMMFLLLQQFHTNNKKIQEVILFLGKRTYGIYLIHFWVIQIYLVKIAFVYKYIQGVPYFIYVIIAVALISFVISYVAELCIIKPSQKICEFFKIKFLELITR